MSEHPDELGTASLPGGGGSCPPPRPLLGTRRRRAQGHGVPAHRGPRVCTATAGCPLGAPAAGPPGKSAEAPGHEPGAVPHTGSARLAGQARGSPRASEAPHSPVGSTPQHPRQVPGARCQVPGARPPPTRFLPPPGVRPALGSLHRRVCAVRLLSSARFQAPRLRLQIDGRLRT